MDTLSLGSKPEEGVLVGRPSKYSPEFREQAVELVRATGKTVAEVARDLQMNDTTLGNWVRADRAERGEPDSSGLLPSTAEERAELTRLRRENARLKTEREILKKVVMASLAPPGGMRIGAWPDRRSGGRGGTRMVGVRPA